MQVKNCEKVEDIVGFLSFETWLDYNKVRDCAVYDAIDAATRSSLLQWMGVNYVALSPRCACLDMTPPRRPSIVSNDEVIAHTLQEEFDNEAAMEASQASSDSYVGSVVKQMQVKRQNCSIR